MAAAPNKGKGRKVKKKAEPNGVAHIKSSFNNTLISITDMQGNVIAWNSGGKVGNKGSRKSTAFAAQMAARQCAEEVHAQAAGRALLADLEARGVVLNRRRALDFGCGVGRLTQALAKGARDMGARIERFCPAMQPM